MRAKTSLSLLAISIAGVLAPSSAGAHWCDDLWGSAYNVTVRPETDTVTVPASGAVSMVVYVQNNMGYLLPNFKLTAEAAGYTISATPSATKTTKALMPGERQKVTFSITGTAGQLSVTALTFHVNFGSGQDGRYAGNSSPSSPSGKAAAIKLAAGGVAPAGFPGIDVFNSQAPQLGHVAQADFGDLNKGLDELMLLYCSGGGSWDHNSEGVLSNSYCNGTATTCPTTGSSHTKFDYPHLWAAGFLVARKSSLGTRLPLLRKRLQCGATCDSMATATGAFAAMALGYLGDDATARTFLQGKATGSNADEALVAKAALYLAGNSADVTSYKSAVQGGLSSSKIVVSSACATALAIRDKDDTAAAKLIGNASWSEPDLGNTSDNGIYSSHLLDIVAWDRRGWAAQGGETGIVSFYGEGTSSGTSSGTTSGTSSGTTSSGTTSSGTTSGTTSSGTTSSGTSGTGGGGGGGGGCEVASGTQLLSALAIFGLMALFIARRKQGNR